MRTTLSRFDILLRTRTPFFLRPHRGNSRTYIADIASLSYTFFRFCTESFCCQSHLSQRRNSRRRSLEYVYQDTCLRSRRYFLPVWPGRSLWCCPVCHKDMLLMRHTHNSIYKNYHDLHHMSFSANIPRPSDIGGRRRTVRCPRMSA